MTVRVSNGLRTTVVGLAMVVFAGCAPWHSSEGTTIPFTILAKKGPPDPGTLSILAATSLNDLRTLFVGIDPRTEPCQVDAGGVAYGEMCWRSITEPSSSLLVALLTYGVCQQTKSVDGELSNRSTLTFTAVNGGQCAFGRGTAPEPQFWLIAIPLKSLPEDLLTIHIKRRMEGAFTRRILLESKTLVDLRPPFVPASDGASRVNEIHRAISEAVADAKARTGQAATLKEFGTRKWPVANLCAPHSSGETTELIPGYFIVLQAENRGGPNGKQEPMIEYHSAGGRTIYCPPSAS